MDLYYTSPFSTPTSKNKFRMSIFPYRKCLIYRNFLFLLLSCLFFACCSLECLKLARTLSTVLVILKYNIGNITLQMFLRNF